MLGRKLSRNNPNERSTKQHAAEGKTERAILRGLYLDSSWPRGRLVMTETLVTFFPTARRGHDEVTTAPSAFEDITAI